MLPLDYNAALVVAGLLWGGAFLLYALRYGPMLLERRVAIEPD